MLIRRRLLLQTAAGLVAVPAMAQAPSEALIAAAKQEGAVTFYTSIDVGVVEKLTATFKTRYPEIRLRVERSGAERILQRVMQEYASGIHEADVAESSDITSFIEWTSRGWLARFVPADVEAYWPKEERDPDAEALKQRYAQVLGV